MRETRASLVDAFTRNPGAGNRAGVVVDGGGHDERAMRDVARAVAASETAFVLAPGEGADLTLRYFTPAMEVPFCGHATVATAHRLAELGRLAVPGRYTLGCAAGRLALELEPFEGGCRVWLETPLYPWSESPIPAGEIARLLGGEPAALDAELPVLRTGPKILVPFRRRTDLWRLAPRYDELVERGSAVGVRGAFAFTRETIEPGSVSHARFFAPAEGIREDPVTGSAHGPLVDYLLRNGVLSPPSDGTPLRARAEQGDAMGKPGRLDLEVMGASGRIRIGGVAVTVIDGIVRCG